MTTNDKALIFEAYKNVVAESHKLQSLYQALMGSKQSILFVGNINDVINTTAIKNRVKVSNIINLDSSLPVSIAKERSAPGQFIPPEGSVN